jgi:Flp pilus assembly pilin Flp
MTSLYIAIMNFLNRDEEGQGLAEYALILALIAIIAIIALIFLGQQVSWSSHRGRLDLGEAVWTHKPSVPRRSTALSQHPLRGVARTAY